MKPLDARPFAFAVAAVLLAALPAAAQDFTVTYKSEDGVTKTYVSQTAVRESTPTEDTIFRIDQNKVIVIDHQKKTYRESTFDQWRKQLNGMMGNPMMMEAARRKGVQVTPSVTKVGPGETIVGYPTEKYVVKSALGETDVWVAPALQVPKAYWELLSPAGAQPGPGMEQLVTEMRKINAVPLKSVSKLVMGITIEDMATSVDKGSIPASAFAVPTGYKAETR
jgi:hypothetical protein